MDEEIYFQKNHLLSLGYCQLKPLKINLLGERIWNMGGTIKNPSLDGDGCAGWLQCHCRDFCQKGFGFG
jgi:hypothetical protein